LQKQCYREIKVLRFTQEKINKFFPVTTKNPQFESEGFLLPVKYLSCTLIFELYTFIPIVHKDVKQDHKTVYCIKRYNNIRHI